MSKIDYTHGSTTFRPQALQVIRAAEDICDDFARQGYSLTLRQLYYRFIATDAFPESRRNAAGTKNHQQNYKWLGDLVSQARVAGKIDWNHIEDRTRESAGGDFGWRSPGQMISSYASGYGITHWDGQEHYLEVWVEKEALADVISRPANRWDVAYFACKGSPSTSAMHDAAGRFKRQERDGKLTHLVYLGDHDPTGIDIPRDVQDRMRLFRSSVTVDRIALNMDQIQELDPPPSPAKEGDSRTSGYVETFGTTDTWELDALLPADLEAMVERAITDKLDMDLYRERLDTEDEERRILTALSDNWDAVEAYIRRQDWMDQV